LTCDGLWSFREAHGRSACVVLATIRGRGVCRAGWGWGGGARWRNGRIGTGGGGQAGMGGKTAMSIRWGVCSWGVSVPIQTVDSVVLHPGAAGLKRVSWLWAVVGMCLPQPTTSFGVSSRIVCSRVRNSTAQASGWQVMRARAERDVQQDAREEFVMRHVAVGAVREGVSVGDETVAGLNGVRVPDGRRVGRVWQARTRSGGASGCGVWGVWWGVGVLLAGHSGYSGVSDDATGQA